MVPTLLETLPDDTEFDLDVRLQAVPRDFSADAAVRRTEEGCPDYPVTEVSCQTCKPPC
jgi:hypothetical protein